MFFLLQITSIPAFSILKRSERFWDSLFVFVRHHLLNSIHLQIFCSLRELLISSWASDAWKPSLCTSIESWLFSLCLFWLQLWLCLTEYSSFYKVLVYYYFWRRNEMDLLEIFLQHPLVLEQCHLEFQWMADAIFSSTLTDLSFPLKYKTGEV